MPKRKPVEAKRVPLNCLVLPETLAWLKAQSSQGKGVDIAVGWARSHDEQAAYYEARRRQELEEEDILAKILTAPAVEIRQPKPFTIERGDTSDTPSGILRQSRAFKGPLLKPKERK